MYLTTGLWIASALAPISLGAEPPAVTGLSAFHSSGQTFLTWQEPVDEATAFCRIYRHDGPIDSVSIDSAQLIAEVWPGSSTFYAERYFKPVEMTWQPRFLDRYVVTDGGPELGADTGLYVFTVAAEDFGGLEGGSAYYAITPVDGFGVENRTALDAGNSIGPLVEAVDDPLPVLSKVLLDGRLEIYTQFMDLRRFNATLASPNSYNDWYGFDDTEPNIQNALNYGFAYAVFVPQVNCATEGEINGAHGVVINLHPFGGERFRPYTFDPAASWCNVYRIHPIDPPNTWWFGFARDHDYRTGLVVPSTDTIENFTEARVLRMLHDLKRHPQHGPKVDMERVYLWGHSMGASGTLAMALRYPNVFSAAHASQPMTNYLTAGDGGGDNWEPDVSVKLGAELLDLPVAFSAPAGWADHLLPLEGTGAWTWQNHQLQLGERRDADAVPIGIDHGLQDTILEWSTQGEPAYGPFDAAARCWSGVVLNALHIPSGILSMPGPYQKSIFQVPFGLFSSVRSETVPGLSNAASNSPLPPVGVGSYNDALTWSASWSAWDGAPTDTPTEWRLSLRTEDNLPDTVDVTPRRLQQFEVHADVPYVWQNQSVLDDTIVDSGVVFADADNLLTLPTFEVTPDGNRAILRPALTADVDSISVATGGTQVMSLLAGGDFAGKLYIVLGSASGTGPALVLDGLSLPLVVDSYFLYTLNSPNGAVLGSSLGILGPYGDATATFQLPTGLSPGLAGLQLHHAFLVVDIPGDQSLTFASNAVGVSLTD